MPPSISELKVTPSFCFAFKIPDDVAASNSISNGLITYHLRQAVCTVATHKNVPLMVSLCHTSLCFLATFLCCLPQYLDSSFVRFHIVQCFVHFHMKFIEQIVKMISQKFKSMEELPHDLKYIHREDFKRQSGFNPITFGENSNYGRENLLEVLK